MLVHSTSHVLATLSPQAFGVAAQLAPSSSASQAVSFVHARVQTPQMQLSPAPQLLSHPCKKCVSVSTSVFVLVSAHAASAIDIQRHSARSVFMGFLITFFGDDTLAAVDHDFVIATWHAVPFVVLLDP